MTRTLFLALPLLALTACGSEPAGKSSTKLDAVEVQPGTISDSMIILDDAAGDGTAVDNSVPDDGTKKEVPKADETATGADTTADSAESGEVIDAPVAKKTAPTPETAAKKAD